MPSGRRRKQEVINTQKRSVVEDGRMKGGDVMRIKTVVTIYLELNKESDKKLYKFLIESDDWRLDTQTTKIAVFRQEVE